MEDYQKIFAKLLADSTGLFFKQGLFLKDQRPTPYFVNIGALGESTKHRWELAKAYAAMISANTGKCRDIDIVFGPSYKGVPIAADTTTALYLEHGIDLKLSFDRKEAKTHGEGSTEKDMFVGAKFFDSCSIYIVDDVGTSMATKVESLEKIASESDIKGINASVAGVGIAVDREQAGPVYDAKNRIILGERGEDAIGNFTNSTGIPVHSIVGVRDVMQFLFDTQYPLLIDDKVQPLSQKRFDEFRTYMDTYGVNR